MTVAPATGTTPAQPPLVPILWRTALTALITVVSVQGLAEVIEPGAWQRTVTSAVLATVVVTGVMRLALRWSRVRYSVLALLGPLMAGVLVMTTAVVVRFGSPVEGAPARSVPASLSLVQTVAAWFDPIADRFQALGDLLGSVGSEIQEGSIPLPGSESLVLLLVIGAVVLYLVTDTLVVGLEMTWGALLPVAGLWAAPLAFLQQIAAVQVALVAAALIALLAVTFRPVPHAIRRNSIAAAAGLVVAVLAVAASPALIDTGSARDLTWFGDLVPRHGSVRLTTNVEVGQNLGSQSSSVAYRYQDAVTAAPPSSSPRATVLSEAQREPMRVSTFVTFDGLTWSARQSSDRSPIQPGQLLHDAASAQQPGADEFTRTITVEGLAGDALPLTVAPASVSGVERGTFDAAHGELRTAGDLPDSYVLTARPELLSASILRKTGSGEGPADADYTVVAPTAHLAQTAALAAQITAGSLSQYDDLVALQDYLRDPQSFTYSAEVAPTEDDDPVWTFLTHRSGYCVQYATAMAIMARTLGIPSRLAQGFLPGAEDENGAVVVTGTQAHAWPEFFFAEIGWVRFEPTPSVQTGEAPAWTRPSATPAPTATKTPTPSATPTPTRSATPTPSQSKSATQRTSTAAATESGQHSAGTGWAAGAAALVLILAAAGSTAWLILRRRRRPLGAEAGWRRVLRAARRAGLAGTRSTTPRQWGDLIQERLRTQAPRRAGDTSESPGSDAAVTALQEVVIRVERLRYSADGMPQDTSDLRAAVTTVVAALRVARRPGPS